MTKAELYQKIRAKFPEMQVSHVKKVAAATLDLLADDLRNAMWQGKETDALTRRDLSPKTTSLTHKLRGELARSIVVKAALLELTYKKPGRKKIPWSQLKRNKK